MRGRAWLLLALLLISSCGKKGSLDVPPGGMEDPRVEREWQKGKDRDNEHKQK